MNEVEIKNKISQMTLREKLLEMTQYGCFLLGFKNCDITGKVDYNDMTVDDLKSLGSYLGISSTEDVIEVRKWRKSIGIDSPVLFMNDVIHGYKTIFPIPLAVACSFNLDLIEKCAKMSAEESKYAGIDVTFSPMVDLVRDARWGRVMESAGEDPYLCGEVGKAFIRGYHDGGLACCVKHFAGYGEAEAGKDYNTTDMSTHTLYEYYLRAYKECLKENPELFMSSFNALNAVPVVASKWLLVDILRDEWGFDGVLISDWGAFRQLENHGYAETLQDFAQITLNTKHDIEMCSPSFIKALPQLIEQGKISEQQVDQAVYRILTLKNKLGLFENSNRFADVNKRDELCLSKQNRQLVREMAQESIVLLKNNDHALPLKQSEKVAFVGPFYDNQDIIGNWSAKGTKDDAVSIRMAVENLLNKKVEGCFGCDSNILSVDESNIQQAVDYCSDYDTIVCCIGEPRFSSGEHHSRADIRIPKPQRRLVKELSKLNKKLVLVIFGGRPQALKQVEPCANAILYAWQPGTEGGNAIVDILYGKVNPCAKTVMSFPRSVGQCPIYYNHLNTGHPKHDDSVIKADSNFGSCYDDEFNSPQYPFGFGLSYTKFEYSNLKLSKNTICKNDTILASVQVTNTGDCDGKEVIQWYVHDKFASCVRPVKQLKGFNKVLIKKGEMVTVDFEINQETLSFYNSNGKLVVEEGRFELFVGGNSNDCLKVEFDFINK